MGRTVIPDDSRAKVTICIQIFMVVMFGFVAYGMYWVYDATDYGYSLKPDFLLSESEQKFREMDRYFDQIKERYSTSGDRDAAEKDARAFERAYASNVGNLSSNGANRRAQKLLKELHRFQERVE